jgi:hypothetical protein
LKRDTAPPGGRLTYTWGDAVLTLAGVIVTLYAAGKADQVAEKGGSVLPFSVAYAVGAVAAIGWWVYYFRKPSAVSRSRARAGRRRGAIVAATPLLGVVGYMVVQFTPVEVQAVVLGACAGFLLAAMLGYGAYVLRQRRRSSA